MSIVAPSICFIKLEWWNSCDIGDIIYQTDFAQWMYVKADVGKPIYSIQKEGSNDGFDEFIATFMKWKKTYKIRIIVNEPQLDALTLIPLHDNIWIYLQNGTNAKIKDLTISEPQWDNCGCHAVIDIEFTKDYLITTKCCVNKSITPILPYHDPILIQINSYETPMDLFFQIIGTAGKTIIVDWKDGHTESFILTGGTDNFQHSYGAFSNYIIEITGELNDITSFIHQQNMARITMVDIPECTNLKNVVIQNNWSFWLLIDAGCIALEEIELQSNKLISLPAIDTFTNLKYVNLSWNALDVSWVNYVLCTIDYLNVSVAPTRIIVLDAPTNDPPDGTHWCNGIAAKASLLGKGWTVATN